MRLSVVEGSLAQVFLNWTTGSVLIGYMLHLGATAAELGLVASVPLLAQAASPLAAWMAGRFGRRKLMTILAAVIGRGLWVLAAAIPQLGLPPHLQSTFLLFCVFMSSMFVASNGTLWSSWMADVVPASRRGAYFGLRTGILGVIGMTANLLAGVLLDRLAAPMSFQVVIVAAVTSGLLSVILYFFHHDPPLLQPRLSLARIISGPLQDLNFRRFLGFATYWQFAVFLSAPFTIPFFLDELGLTFTQVATWSAIAAVSALFTASFWGRMADRAGNKAVLSIATVICGTALPGTWILAGMTDHIGFVWLAGVVDAIAWGAITPAIFNLALGSAPLDRRLGYMSIYSLGSGLAGFLAGAISGPLLIFLSGGGEVDRGGYYLLFIIGGMGRATAWLFLRGVQEPESWRTRDLLYYFRDSVKSLRAPWRS